MMKLLVALLLLFSGLAWVHGANINVTMGNISIRVMGRSGKILIRQNDKANTIDEIVVQMENITEVAGNETVKGNNHKVNSFASQEFNFSGPTDTAYKNLNATQLTFESKIHNVNATLKVYLYVFETKGDIVNGDEVTQVKEGTVKFNIELKDWQFCEGNSSDCNEAGTAVDFAFVIKTKGKPEVKPRAKSSKNADKKQAVNYNLGNADIQLSSKVNVDGKVTSMANGFPKVEGKTFTFRFPKFNNTVMYDPAIDLKTPGANGGDTGNGGQITNVLNLFLIVLSLAFARFLA